MDGKEYQFEGEVHLKRIDFIRSHLEGARLKLSYLEGSKMTNAHLEIAVFYRVNLKNAEVRAAHVDGSTSFWKCKVDRYTDLRGVGLDNCRIDAGTKQLLKYNNRRMNWEEWYWGTEKHRLLDEEDEDKKQWLKVFQRVVRLIMTSPVRMFWWVSDYGISTKRIVFTFWGLALLFAAIYSNTAHWFPPGIVSNLKVEPHLPLWHYGILVFLRPVYFSVVTMTTLGFGDMYADAQSICGHILLTIQVILGYVLLGALVTRFAVLFTAGGAGRDV